MPKKKKTIVGNWKMNVDTIEEAKKIVRTVKKKTATVKKTNIVFCPPALYLPGLQSLISKKYQLGAQNVFTEDKGSYTGEISPLQVKQFNTQYVIVGHSERRNMGETDNMVNKKLLAVLRAQMTPIVCIGEAVHDENGEYLGIIKNQLTEALASVSKGIIGDVIIAYEPIWAIGGKVAMSARDVHEMTLYIKKCLQNMFGSYASGVNILYGGAVNTENAGEIVRDGYVDGLLVGRDSIDADDFVQIIKAVDSIK